MGFSRNTPNRGHFKLKFIASAVVIVMSVVLLTALFNWTSLEKLCFDHYVTAFSMDAERISKALGGGVDGAPLQEEQAIRNLLDKQRERIMHRLGSGPAAAPGLTPYGSAAFSVSLVSPNGLILESTDPSQKNTRVPLKVLTGFQNAAPEEGYEHHVVAAGAVYVGCPVQAPLAVGGAGGAYTMISFDRDWIPGLLAERLAEERRLFWILLSAAVLLMIALLSITLPGGGDTSITGHKKPYAMIVWCCIAFQILFSGLFAAGYRSELLTLVQMEARSARLELTQGMAALAAKDTIQPFREKIRSHAESVIEKRRGIGGISVAVDGGPVRSTIIARERQAAPAASNLFGMLYDPDQLISVHAAAVPYAGAIEIQIFPSTPYINHMLSEMVMDGVTVLVISILLFMELVFLMRASLHRKAAPKRWKSAPVEYILMRPAAFLFLFAIDLSMSFIPLYMERLYEPMLGLPKDVVLGLPITIEFIFVGLAIFGSGYWVDRRGWHEPFVAGLLFSVLGLLYSWLAPDALHFILSRGLIGVGYGLSLMASQGFVITYTDLKTKALGLAQLFAGIYAGSICGGAAGAMLADRFGFSFTFQVGALIIMGIVVYTFVFMRHAMEKPMPAAAASSTATASAPVKVRFSEFMGNRIVISLILLSSLPASIAVVGFLNYFCPLYLNSLGVTQSSIGRILMIYGVSLVYFGPIVGKYTDLSDDKRMFVFAGCILGSLTFLSFYVFQGIFAAMLALLMLGLSSCFVLSSQSAYLLSLDVTRRFGQGKAVGIFRSTSRIGQALGPIVFSGLILAQSLESGIIFFGLIYLVTALLFFLFTQRDSRYHIEEAA